MVAQRDRERLTIDDANQLKTRLRQAHESEIRENLFVSLQLAFKPNAPLVLHTLEAAHKQGAPYASRFDGVAAWRAIARRGETAAQLPGEAANQDAKMAILAMKPLSADASQDKFSASNKWHIWALGSPEPKSRASPWAPRAALPQAKGRPWPVSPDGRQRALRSPLPAQSRALPSPWHASHACRCPHTRQPALSARDEPPCCC